VQGYEIHCGLSAGEGLMQPAVAFDDGRSDGAISSDGQIMGTYLHGWFDTPAACSALLAWAGLPEATTVDLQAERERGLERLADSVEANIDCKRLFAMLGANEAKA